MTKPMTFALMTFSFWMGVLFMVLADMRIGPVAFAPFAIYALVKLKVSL